MGRKQSVAALARLLRNGSSVSVVGGAKIGKTSLVRQVALELGEAALLSSGRELLARPLVESRILLVDDAEALGTPQGRDLLAGLGRYAAVCLTASRPWREFAASAIHLKPFPMATWDRRLAGALIARVAPDAPISTVARLVQLSGNHPFLLKGLLSRWPDIDSALAACRPRFELAFASWLEAMSPDARPLMDFLVERAGYVAFDDARKRLGRPDLKLEADRLCWLGVVERRLRGDMAVATLRAGCGLFNEWYRARRGAQVPRA